MYWHIDWDKVIVNEIYTEVSMTAVTICMFRKFDSDVRKWFLTDTSFESFSAQMTLWINIIEMIYWRHSVLSSTWSEKYSHQKKLKKCSLKKLHDMNKTHKHIVDEKKSNIHVRENHLKNLTIILKTLWLKCSATQFTFYTHVLINVSFNIHQNIDCSLLSWFSNIVNASVVTISDQMKKELWVKLQIWQNNNCLDDKLTLNLNNWLMRVQRLQVLSTFLMLELLKNTKNLMLAETENHKRCWVHNQSDTLYDLQQCNSSYKNNIAEICLNYNFIKIAAINKLIQTK